MKRGSPACQLGDSRPAKRAFPEAKRKNRVARQKTGGVGGPLPDRWNDFTSHNKYFLIPRLKVKGVLPCKTLLDKCFDHRIKSGEDDLGNIKQSFWHPSMLVRPDLVLESIHQSRNDHMVSSIGRDQEIQSSSSATEQNLPPCHPEISDVQVVVNLCLTERHYSVPEVRNSGLDYYRFKVDGGGSIPPLRTVLAFLELFAFIGRTTKGLVVLHCTHGVNRTGFFSVVLLVVFGGYPFYHAVDVFEKARGHPINRPELKIALARLCALPFSSPDFGYFMQVLFEISTSSDFQSVLYLEDVPSVIATTDLYSILLESHYGWVPSIYTPLGLLDVSKVESDESRQTDDSTTDHEIPTGHETQADHEMPTEHGNRTGDDKGPTAKHRCTIKLTFRCSQDAKRFEDHWPKIRLESCLRTSVLPLVEQPAFAEEDLREIRLVFPEEVSE